MAEEKGFCELLSDQIIDEKKTLELYQRLLDLFEEDKPMLTTYEPEIAYVRNLLHGIRAQEGGHASELEATFNVLCKPKEK